MASMVEGDSRTTTERLLIDFFSRSAAKRQRLILVSFSFAAMIVAKILLNIRCS